MSILIINAPRLDFCPIISVVREYKGIKETAPLVFSALLFTIESLGLKLLMSKPAPDYTPAFAVL